VNMNLSLLEEVNRNNDDNVKRATLKAVLDLLASFPNTIYRTRIVLEQILSIGQLNLNSEDCQCVISSFEVCLSVLKDLSYDVNYRAMIPIEVIKALRYLFQENVIKQVFKNWKVTYKLNLLNIISIHYSYSPGVGEAVIEMLNDIVPLNTLDINFVPFMVLFIHLFR